jgi:hypothetical protein
VSILIEVAKELLGMFLADAALSTATIILIAVVGSRPAFDAQRTALGRRASFSRVSGERRVARGAQA